MKLKSLFDVWLNGLVSGTTRKALGYMPSRYDQLEHNWNSTKTGVNIPIKSFGCVRCVNGLSDAKITFD